MEERAVWTKEENDARNDVRVELARITKRLKAFQDDPLAEVDLPPHLVGRR